MKILVIGYNDLAVKPRGPTKRFKEEDCFEATEIPTQEFMKNYCAIKGYPILKGVQTIPGVGIFRSDGRCEPVYTYLEE